MMPAEVFSSFPLCKKIADHRRACYWRLANVVFLQGIKIGDDVPSISHLPVADHDTVCLLFAKASIEEAQAILSILDIHGAASGQGVNQLRCGKVYWIWSKVSGWKEQQLSAPGTATGFSSDWRRLWDLEHAKYRNAAVKCCLAENRRWDRDFNML
ncbi:uncharacterized protein LOC113779845 [Coffea eugenioides]|uniref:uncharacterized protein LOC113779845 n=1 Tax=Coffea eugenioides TaxID=49369 RepID=UPI000F607DD2|nr:uncharacterized protein LOC113779845 [Coffea eugenioides]XP_027181391.1 uncharacterized protein LOC113779845 [Coffea eugenioides]